MEKRKIGLVLFLLIAAPLFAQVTPNPITSKPVPTLAQCRADLDAWSTSIDPQTDNKSTFTYDDLTEMVLEMSRCGFSVDAKNNDNYVKVEDRIQACIAGRYFDFIRRHPALWDQFTMEDAGGAR
jgi:Zn-dependent oligopeptidase